MPSSPVELSPQEYNRSVVVSASTNDAPAETVVQDAPAGPDTNTGDDTAVAVLLLPSCPIVFWPQPYNTPAVVMAMENTEPDDIIAQLAPIGPDTNTGDETVVAELLPN